MKKLFASLGTLAVVAALALSLAAPAHAQLPGTTDTSGTATSTTGGTGSTGGTGTSGGTSGTSGTDTTNPGLPNTGAGGEAATNLAILLGTGLIAIGGTAVLGRKLNA